MNKYYDDWTPIVMFSNKGDEVIHKGDYLVCVHADDNFCDDKFLEDGKWSYSIQLPISGRCVYPGEKGNPLFWDSKNEAKKSVDEWDDSTFEALRKLDDTAPPTEQGFCIYTK